MRIAGCPECGGNHFTSDVVRADAFDPARPERHFEVYGHWFNKCMDCGAWSLHRDGKNVSIPNNRRKPKRHSEPAIE